VPSDRSKYGSKSLNLAQLAKASYSVPDGFCISVEAFKDHILKGSREFKNVSAYPTILQQYREMTLETPLKPEFERELDVQIQSIVGSASDLLAVRSSAIEEDLSSGSFAGVYSTILDVNGKKDILDAIRSCWYSYFSEPAHYYRSRKAVKELNGMSVLIQRMIKPRFSGILFTNGISNIREEYCIIEIVSGDARNLVDGKVSGKKLLVNRKSFRIHSNDRKVLLKDRWLAKRLARVGLEIELLMGSPQDIEWCVDHQRKLWIIQTRPITELPNERGISETRLLNGWERAYYEPFSTLGCHLATKRYLNWVKAINRFYLLDFRPRVKVENNILFHTVPWDRKVGLVRIWMFIFDILRWFNRKHIRSKYLCSTLPNYNQTLSVIKVKNISRMTDEELFCDFSLVVNVYLDSQKTSFALGRLASFSAHVLKLFLKCSMSSEKYININSILSGLDNVTISRDILFEEISQKIVEQLVKEKLSLNFLGNLEEILPKIKNGNILANRLEDFQERFGYMWADRYPRDPAWEFDMGKFESALKDFGTSSSNETLKNKVKKLKSERNQLIVEFEKKLDKGIFSRAKLYIFRNLLFDLGNFFPHKEERNDHLYSVIMILKSLCIEIGNRLSLKGIIKEPKDVFFLTENELTDNNFLNIRYTDSIKEIIDERKTVYKHSLKLIELTNDYIDHDIWSSLDQFKSEFSGDGCSPGFKMGIAKVIIGMGNFDKIDNDSILVCKNFRPAMSPILSRIGGLIVEKGSIISHGAILSREYGVPAVFNVENITRLIKDGDKVSLDGNTGIIQLDSNDSFVNAIKNNEKNHSNYLKI